MTHTTSTQASTNEPEAERRFTVPLVLRGQVHTDNLVRHKTRRADIWFETPDVIPFVRRGLTTLASDLEDLATVDFDEIVQLLDELGKHLTLEDNPHFAEAFELSCLTSNLTRPILERLYNGMGDVFKADLLVQIIEATVGVDYLNGWVTRSAGGRTYSVRAFGPRMVSILSGNSPMVAARSIARTVLVRSDVIFKAPSNDPATAAAIARTLCEIAPSHPVTRHVTVAYWKGGDSAVEPSLYDPARVEKIYATGGEASMRHIRQYLRPGLDLIAADPKLSATLIGAEALQSDGAMNDAAHRLARDVGINNQEACVNARVVYVEVPGGESNHDALRRFARAVYRELVALPPAFSTPVPEFPLALRDSMNAIRHLPEWYDVIGGGDGEGAVVVSLLGDPVDFSDELSGRVTNLVPVESLTDAMRWVTAATQTVGVYPASRKAAIRDRMALSGTQRIVTLGHATETAIGSPIDGMEPLRRLCKWIVDEEEPQA
jgi:hypothetical protein